MPKRSILADDEETEINLSPMIDCIFILLIFFIVTTVFVEEKGLAVHKPDAAASSALTESDNLAFEITADNRILLEGEEIGLRKVTGVVKSEASEPDTPVVIRVHEKADHGTFVSVWDAAKRGGTLTLSFSTIN